MSNPHPVSMAAEVSTSKEDPEWDRYVQSHNDPHTEQLSVWGTFRTREGWSPSRLIFRQENHIFGGAQLLEHAVGKLGVVGYVARGPLINPECGLEQTIASELKTAARNRSLAYLVVSLPYKANAMVAPLLEAGFIHRPEQLPPANGVMATQILDLSKELVTLFREVRKSRRKEIGRGQRSGTLVRKGTREDLPLFVDLVDQHCARIGVRSNMPGNGFAQLMWDYGHPRGNVHLFMVESAYRTVGALMLLTIGQWARAWRIGWNGSQADKFPTQVMIWETIQWAKQSGFRYFDLVGFDINDAKEIQAGRPPDAPFRCPFSFFKAGWGGEIRILPGDYCYFPNPLLRQIMRVGGARFLNHTLVSRITDTIHSHVFRHGR
jgi:peptidoglycan pentaglycine glycine transferase (the first glycine)